MLWGRRGCSETGLVGVFSQSGPSPAQPPAPLPAAGSCPDIGRQEIECLPGPPCGEAPDPKARAREAMPPPPCRRGRKWGGRDGGGGKTRHQHRLVANTAGKSWEQMWGGTHQGIQPAQVARVNPSWKSFPPPTIPAQAACGQGGCGPHSQCQPPPQLTDPSRGKQKQWVETPAVQQAPASSQK